MSAFQNWLNQLNFEKLLELLITIAAALVCITLHEVSHGYAAYRLGDPTAKNAGRLTLNPIRHIDPVGLLVMAVARFGWARAVPINPGNFKHFRRDTAITALAGPVANVLITALALLLHSTTIGLYLRWDRPQWLLYVDQFFSIRRSSARAWRFLISFPFRRWTAPKCCFPFCPGRCMASCSNMSGLDFSCCFFCCGSACWTDLWYFCGKDCWICSGRSAAGPLTC